MARLFSVWQRDGAEVAVSAGPGLCRNDQLRLALQRLKGNRVAGYLSVDLTKPQALQIALALLAAAEGPDALAPVLERWRENDEIAASLKSGPKRGRR